jgi:hypothetical protein
VKKSNKLAVGLALAPMALMATAAFATPIDGGVVSGNDCSGVLGKAPDCVYKGSPSISKWDADTGFTDEGFLNTALFPSLTGAEWTITPSAGNDGRTGTWTYTLGPGDPIITAFTYKGGPEFVAFGPVGAPVGGVQTGSWDVTGLQMGGLSHLTFFDTRVPVPEPTTLALLGIGLVGAGLASRRKRA